MKSNLHSKHISTVHISYIETQKR